MEEKTHSLDSMEEKLESNDIDFHVSRLDRNIIEVECRAEMSTVEDKMNRFGIHRQRTDSSRHQPSYFRPEITKPRIILTYNQETPYVIFTSGRDGEFRLPTSEDFFSALQAIAVNSAGQAQRIAPTSS
ncbi:MAG: hypothetical protein V3V61_02555 [Gammaproteobacteria bacterium]